LIRMTGAVAAPLPPGSDSSAGQSTSNDSTAAQPTEVLAGSIERVTFHNTYNGFYVLRIKARGHLIIRSLFFIGNFFVLHSFSRTT
jgi:exodeoxyribonuclease V alpha subunit